MATLNQITLIGNLGQEPELKTTESGTQFCRLSIATTDRAYTDKNGNAHPARTEWHRATIFGHSANFAAMYAHKGDPVLIQGKMRYRDYTDKDGKKMTSAEIEADTFDLLTRKADNTTQAQPAVQPMPAATYTPIAPYQAQPQQYKQPVQPWTQPAQSYPQQPAQQDNTLPF